MVTFGLLALCSTPLAKTAKLNNMPSGYLVWMSSYEEPLTKSRISGLMNLPVYSSFPQKQKSCEACPSELLKEMTKRHGYSLSPKTQPPDAEVSCGIFFSRPHTFFFHPFITPVFGSIQTLPLLPPTPSPIPFPSLMNLQ